jgi:hypothetical protein
MLDCRLSKDDGAGCGTLPARTALKLFNRPRVRILLGRRYGKALHVHQPALPPLCGRWTPEIVAALEQDGVLRHHDRGAGPGERPRRHWRSPRFGRSALPTKRTSRTAKGEVFTIVPPERVFRYPSIYLLGLQDRLLDIAENYVGLPPAYDGVTINYTVADGREVSTRKWHRDWEDRRMLKVAVYLHDVDEDAGPFQMIKRHDTLQNDQDGFNYELADDATLLASAGALICRRYRQLLRQGRNGCLHRHGALLPSRQTRHRPRPHGDILQLFRPEPAAPVPLRANRNAARRRCAPDDHAAEAAEKRAAQWRKRLSIALRMIPPASL